MSALQDARADHPGDLVLIIPRDVAFEFDQAALGVTSARPDHLGNFVLTLDPTAVARLAPHPFLS